jgi:hypothetical protein
VKDAGLAGAVGDTHLKRPIANQRCQEFYNWAVIRKPEELLYFGDEAVA